MNYIKAWSMVCLMILRIALSHYKMCTTLRIIDAFDRLNRIFSYAWRSPVRIRSYLSAETIAEKGMHERVNVSNRRILARTLAWKKEAKKRDRHR